MTRDEARALRSIADEIDNWEFPDAPEMGQAYIAARVDLLTRLLHYTRTLRERADAVDREPEPDPLAHVKVGDPDPTDFCGWCAVVNQAEGVLCTREEGHPGQHVAGGDDFTVLAVWPAVQAQPKAGERA